MSSLWTNIRSAFVASTNAKALILAGLLFAPVEAWCANVIPDRAPPASETTWHCPVKDGASIAQGNGGELSHTDQYNRFAWDYNIPVGTPLVAARGGVVTQVMTSSNIGGFEGRFMKDANSIVIAHTDGTASKYLHLSKNTTLVRVGEYVMQGELIGYSGETGYASGPHLHFTAVRDNLSISITFADHPTNGGIPAMGERHTAAAPPVVPQEVITLCKQLARAAARASELACPDIGLALAAEGPTSKPFADYHYAMVLAAARTRFAAALHDLAATWANDAADDLTSALMAKRVELVLASLAKPMLKELALEDVLIAAKARSKVSNPEVTKVVARAKIRELIAAKRADCLADISDAGGKYIAIAKRDSVLKDIALADFRRLILGYQNRFVADLKRLSDESDRCLAKHKAVVLEDAKGVATMSIALAEYWKTYFPAEKADAEALLTKVRSDFEHIQAATK
jgi:Peptidase family M23